jgi:hypothetical protein
MALGSKYYYETIIQQARIQFFDDAILLNEWVAHNGDEPTISVPLSPGAVIYRTEWKKALTRIRNWVDGIPKAGIIFPANKTLNNFDSHIIKTGEVITFDFSVDDITDISFILREISYNRPTDQITIAPRPVVINTIYWVDYLNELQLLVDYENVVEEFYRNGYGS